MYLKVVKVVDQKTKEGLLRSVYYQVINTIKKTNFFMNLKIFYFKLTKNKSFINALEEINKIYPAVTKKNGKSVINWFIADKAAKGIYAVLNAMPVPALQEILLFTYDQGVSFEKAYTTTGYRIKDMDIDDCLFYIDPAKDIQIVTLKNANRLFVPVIRPEYFLAVKIYNRHPENLEDAIWLINNIKIDAEYFDEIIKRWQAQDGYSQDVNAQTLFRLKSSPEKLREYISRDYDRDKVETVR